MATFILYTILESIDENGMKSFSATIQSDGIEKSMQLNFKDNNDSLISSVKDLYVLTGNFKEEHKPFRISLSDVYFDKFPVEENWEAFFLNYFISQKARVIVSSWNDITLSVFENELYVSCTISKDKKTLKKLEFGRYMPLENPENVRKSTSWTKGVFVNDNHLNVNFLQTSWDGEDGKKYCLEYSKQNEKRILDVLQIPFNVGWTEVDTSVGKENNYKASAIANINGKKEQWTYHLRSIAEQDIPLPLDFPLRWLLRFYFDGFWCNSKRRVDKTVVLPINRERTTKGK